MSIWLLSSLCNLILKKYPLFEFYCFDSPTVEHCGRTLKHFVTSTTSPQINTGLQFFLDNMVNSYLYAVFFTLFVGFFEERDIFLVLDLFSLQNYSVILYLAIVIIILFSKKHSQNFGLSQIMAFSKNLGIIGVIRDSQQFKIRLPDLVQQFESDLGETSKIGSFIESDQSHR